MEQYDKSGPVPETTQTSKSDLIDTIKRLEQRVTEQDRTIRNLERSIRSLKEKLTQHANYLNQGQRE